MYISAYNILPQNHMLSPAYHAEMYNPHITTLFSSKPMAFPPMNTYKTAIFFCRKTHSSFKPPFDPESAPPFFFKTHNYNVPLNLLLFLLIVQPKFTVQIKPLTFPKSTNLNKKLVQILFLLTKSLPTFFLSLFFLFSIFFSFLSLLLSQIP